MSIGMGIFLGSLCFAGVYLYAQTKDRWKWRLLARWSARIVGGLVVLLAFAVAYLHFAQSPESLPTPATSYADISLGDSMDEVMYVKGIPSNVGEKAKDGPWSHWFTLTKIQDIPNNKGVRDYSHWSYESDYTGRLDVDFSNESRRVIRVFCYSTAISRCPGLLNVTPDTTEASVLRLLGKPVSTELGKELGPAKRLNYPQLHAAFLLQRRQVYAIELQ